MLLNELLSTTHAANPLIKSASDAISSLWNFKSAVAISNSPLVVQFRKAPGDQEGELSYKHLDYALQNALHKAGVKYKSAKFEEVPRANSYTPYIAYVISF